VYAVFVPLLLRLSTLTAVAKSAQRIIIALNPYQGETAMRILIDSTPAATVAAAELADMLIELAGFDERANHKSVVVTDEQGQLVVTGILADFRLPFEPCYA
jgi:hypothetical protein